jgi:hypothetical protein
MKMAPREGNIAIIVPIYKREIIDFIKTTEVSHY